MPKLRQPPSDDTPAASNVRIRLSVIEDPQAEDLRAMTPEEVVTWRKLRRKFFEAETQHPEFDPRLLLALPPHRAHAWRERRHVWLRHLFRDDPRVEVDR